MLKLTEYQTVAEIPVTPKTLKTRFEHEHYFVIYKDFVTFYVSGVVGIRQFNRNKSHTRYRTYVTVSDEAFAVLTIENNWDRWASMAGNENMKESTVSSMYTTLRDKRKTQKLQREDTNDSDSGGENDNVPQARRYRGWSALGIARYNQLFDEIKEYRTTPTFGRLEDYLMERFQAEDEENGIRKNKRPKVEDNVALPVARNELWVEQEPRSAVTTAGNAVRLPPGLESLGIAL
jgi:hypothetical protein